MRITPRVCTSVFYLYIVYQLNFYGLYIIIIEEYIYIYISERESREFEEEST